MPRNSLCRRTLAVIAAAFVVSGVAVFGPAAPPAAAGPASYHIEGGGFGHGVGMSQYGARGYADAGYAYPDILKSYYTGTAVEPKEQPATLRIWLGEDATAPFDAVLHATNAVSFVIAGETLATAAANDTIRIDVVNSKFDVYINDVNRISQRGGTGDNLYVFFGTSPLTLDESGHRYNRGNLEFDIVGSNLRMLLINLSMQDYLYGLGEVPSSWPVEALRAQAVAARTYALEKVNRLGQNRAGCGCALYRTVSDQNYVGYEKQAGVGGDRWIAAVNDTNQQTITYGGNPIQAFYSSSSGGHTENSENVFFEALPYLRGVPDPYDSAGGTNSLHAWKRDFSRENLQAWLNADGATSVGTLDRIEIVAPLGVSGRVTRKFDDAHGGIRIVGSSGTKRVSGDTFRSVVNARSNNITALPSSLMRFDGFAPYGGFTGGVFVGAGTLEGDETPIVVTGADQGGSPHVRVFRTDGSPTGTSFYAYDPRFLGGVRVAACNALADGNPEEIVTAPGPGGGAHVRIWSRTGDPMGPGFLAYPESFTGGIYVGCADVDPANPGDEIITGAGAGGGPHVRVFTRDGALLGQFMAYDPLFRGGVRVAGATATIVTAPGPGGGPHVRMFAVTGTDLGGFMAYGANFFGGIYVAAGDVVGDTATEIVTGAGESGASHVRMFSTAGAEQLGFYAFGGDQRGARVAVGRGVIAAASGTGTASLARVFVL